MNMPREFSIRTYVETLSADRIAAAAAAGRAPVEGETPIAAARTHFHMVMLGENYSLDPASVAEVHRQAIVVDEHNNWRPANADEEPTGDLVHWTAKGFPREASDANTPVLDGRRQPDGSAWAYLPMQSVASGGSVRVRHMYGAEVTVYAFNLADEPIGYLFASPIDDDVLHVETVPGTVRLRVERDA